MRRRQLKTLLLLGVIGILGCSSVEVDIASPEMDPTTLLWYTHPAEKWDNALLVGNGCLGSMVFGLTDTERIHFNEETDWSGGPYSQTVEGGHRGHPEIQRLIFAGEYYKAHKLFGRHTLDYPIEQMKYQSFGELSLRFSQNAEFSDYRHQLDLDTAVATTRYKQDGVAFTPRVFDTPVDQVIVVRITAVQSGLENPCRVRSGIPVKILYGGNPVPFQTREEGFVEFKTVVGAEYTLVKAGLS